jgi:hypothetical protein
MVRRASLALLIATVATLAAFSVVALGGPAIATLELTTRDALTPALAPG